MPCPFSELIVSVPLPFNVRSSFEKITASILLSSMASNSAVFISMFSEPSASVMKVLPALLTYIAALVTQVISALSSTSCTFSSSASTTSCPSESVPEMIYVPPDVIVITFPSTVTPSTVSSVEELSELPLETVVESSDKLIFTESLSS